MKILDSQPDFEESSSPGEFHPQALTDPDVTVSRHPALIDQPQVSNPSANERITPARDAQSDPTNEPHPAAAVANKILFESR